MPPCQDVLVLPFPVIVPLTNTVLLFYITCISVDIKRYFVLKLVRVVQKRLVPMRTISVSDNPEINLECLLPMSFDHLRIWIITVFKYYYQGLSIQILYRKTLALSTLLHFPLQYIKYVRNIILCLSTITDR